MAKPLKKQSSRSKASSKSASSGFDKDAADRKRKRVFHVLLLVCITVGVWSIGSFGDFVWIDKVEILEGRYRITDRDDFAQVWTTSLDAYMERDEGAFESRGGYLRPLYASSISLDWLLWKDNAFLYKVENVFWHTVVVIGLYVLALQLFHRRKDRSIIALGSAVLFAVHPFGVHSVTWISGRKDTLCAAFGVLALIAFGRLLRQVDSVGRRTLLMGAILVTMFCALFSKELAVVVPAFATIWFWYSQKGNEKLKVHALLGLFLMWGTVGGYFWYRQTVLGGFGLNSTYPSDSLLLNIATSCRLLVFYVFRILVPRQPSIVDRWEISQDMKSMDWAAIIFVALVLLILAYLILRKRPGGLVLGWFAIWLLPATGLIPLNHMYAERYLYPASWGLIALLMIGTVKIAGRFKKPDAALKFVLAVSAVLLGLATVRNFKTWSDDKRLFSKSVRMNKEYAEGLSALALMNLEKNELEVSLSYAERAIAAAENPCFRSFWSRQVVYANYGIAAYRLKDFETAEKAFLKVIEARPNNAQSYYFLAKVSVEKKMPKRAATYFLKAISINPEDLIARNDLGHLYLQNQQFQQCVEVLRPILEKEPDNALAKSNLASAMLAMKQYELAETHFQSLVDTNPENASFIAKLSWCKFENGQDSEGWQLLQKAFSIDPDDPTAIFVGRTYRSQSP